jgi:hypothetical protein
MKLVLGLAILAVLLVIIIPIAVTAKRFVDVNRKVRSCGCCLRVHDCLADLTVSYTLHPHTM